MYVVFVMKPVLPVLQDSSQVVTQEPVSQDGSTTATNAPDVISNANYVQEEMIQNARKPYA